MALAAVVPFATFTTATTVVEEATQEATAHVAGIELGGLLVELEVT